MQHVHQLDIQQDPILQNIEIHPTKYLPLKIWSEHIVSFWPWGIKEALGTLEVKDAAISTSTFMLEAVELEGLTCCKDYILMQWHFWKDSNASMPMSFIVEFDAIVIVLCMPLSFIMLRLFYHKK